MTIGVHFPTVKTSNKVRFYDRGRMGHRSVEPYRRKVANFRTGNQTCQKPFCRSLNTVFFYFQNLTRPAIKTVFVKWLSFSISTFYRWTPSIYLYEQITGSIFEKKIYEIEIVCTDGRRTKKLYGSVEQYPHRNVLCTYTSSVQYGPRYCPGECEEVLLVRSFDRPFLFGRPKLANRVFVLGVFHNQFR